MPGQTMPMTPDHRAEHDAQRERFLGLRAAARKQAADQDWLQGVLGEIVVEIEAGAPSASPRRESGAS